MKTLIRSTQFYFNLILVGISIILINQSLNIHVKDEFLSSPKIFPLFLSITMLILALVILFKEIKSKEVYNILPENLLFFLGFIILTFLYIFFIPIIKFSFATVAFLFICFIFFKATNVWKSMVISVGFVIVIVIIFERVFNIIFP